MENSFYDFIIYCAFEQALIYGNKKSLTLNQLSNYRKIIIKKLYEYFSQYDSIEDEDFEKLLLSFLKINLEMTKEQEQIFLKEFLQEHSELFYLEENNVILHDNKIKSKEEFSNMKFELDCYNKSEIGSDSKFICGYIINNYADLEALRILGANKVKDDINSFLDFESQIEKMYYEYSNPNIQSQIDMYQYVSMCKKNKILNLDHFSINSYLWLLGKIRDTYYQKKELEILDKNILEHDNFYQNNTYIDDEIDDIFNHAIFDNNLLFPHKLYADIYQVERYKSPSYSFEELYEPFHGDYDALLEKFVDKEEDEEFIDEFDDDVDFSEDEEYYNEKVEYQNEMRNKYIFYLNYIKFLEEYQNKFGAEDDLEKVKSRLLYLLDNYNLKLYNSNRIQSILDKLLDPDINYKKEFYDFYVLSRLFYFDLLNNINDENLLKKIIFISSYYRLTNDKRINKILKIYKKSPKGLLLYDAIVNNKKIELYEGIKKINKKYKTKKD